MKEFIIPLSDNKIKTTKRGTLIIVLRNDSSGEHLTAHTSGVLHIKNPKTGKRIEIGHFRFDISRYLRWILESKDSLGPNATLCTSPVRDIENGKIEFKLTAGACPKRDVYLHIKKN